MNTLIPKDTEIMSWDPENMDSYWSQCRQVDSRPFDTKSLIGGYGNQCDSQAAFNQMLHRLEKKNKLL